jgi:histidinol-phosphate/aromatic aminotransferase/cobyric acid decarboxylase-like protein
MQIFNKYEADYHRACARFIAERADFEQQLGQLPQLRVIPSHANYFLCEVQPPFTARGLVLTMLKEHNILLRDCSTKIGLNPSNQYLRIAVRNHQDNARLIQAMKTIDR